MDAANMAQLKELASMKESGILNEEEFAQQKAAILSASIAAPVMPVQAVPAQMQPGMPPVSQMQAPTRMTFIVEKELDGRMQVQLEDKAAGIFFVDPGPYLGPAGIVMGDRLVTINGEAPKHATDAASRTRNAKKGAQLTLDILRQPIQFQAARPPPPGCPLGGEFKMVKYSGPATQQAQSQHSSMCCILGVLFMNPICCLLSGCPPRELKDEKEVYQVNSIKRAERVIP